MGRPQVSLIPMLKGLEDSRVATTVAKGTRFPRSGILKSVLMAHARKHQWTLLLVALLVGGILVLLASDGASAHADFTALLPFFVLSALLPVATGWQATGEELPCRLKPLPLNVASRAPPTLSIS